eukprot:sb/3479483/
MDTREDNGSVSLPYSGQDDLTYIEARIEANYIEKGIPTLLEHRINVADIGTFDWERDARDVVFMDEYYQYQADRTTRARYTNNVACVQRLTTDVADFTCHYTSNVRLTITKDSLELGSYSPGSGEITSSEEFCPENRTITFVATSDSGETIRRTFTLPGFETAKSCEGLDVEVIEIVDAAGLLEDMVTEEPEEVIWTMESEEEGEEDGDVVESVEIAEQDWEAGERKEEGEGDMVEEEEGEEEVETENKKEETEVKGEKEAEDEEKEAEEKEESEKTEPAPNTDEEDEVIGSIKPDSEEEKGGVIEEENEQKTPELKEDNEETESEETDSKEEEKYGYEAEKTSPEDNENPKPKEEKEDENSINNTVDNIKVSSGNYGDDGNYGEELDTTVEEGAATGNNKSSSVTIATTGILLLLTATFW